MYDEKFEQFKQIVKKFNSLTLEQLYEIIDRIVHPKSPPTRNQTYYKRFGRWIAKLEAEGILEAQQYVQVWKVKKEDI